MKILDKIGLMVFSSLMLIICVITCTVAFGWLDLDLINNMTKAIMANQISTNILVTLSVILILLAIKCIFFPSDEKEINGVKDGILLKNSDGQLVISKATLEELVNNIVKGFSSVQNPVSQIVVDKEGGLVVNVIFSVTQEAVIKELSTNLQSKIKTTIKKTSDLEVKEVNISIRNLEQQKTTVENNIG